MSPSTTTSKSPTEAFVWIWLPRATEPVVAGRLVAADGDISFVYGRSYRERKDAIPLYLPELPLQSRLIRPLNGLSMPGAIRDASPDAWGRRVILNRIFGLGGTALDEIDLPELTFLLQSGSDRIGALDFQTSSNRYVARESSQASLAELLTAAERVEHNVPLTPELDLALHQGTPIGGARPKALINETHTKYIAKFSSSNDTYNVVKGEFIAMRLASIAGLDVASVALVRTSGKDVLLVERFDRSRDGQDWRRTMMVSALTVLGLREMESRYASYQDFAEVIRFRFSRVTETLRELFARISFSVLVGNLDDHARNHAAFWDGTHLTLTPAYDICPQPRAGEEASHAMFINGQDRASQIRNCLAAAKHFHLSEEAAIAIIERQIRAIGDNWRSVCDAAALGRVDRTLFWGRQFLNRFAFYGLDGAAVRLSDLADHYRTEQA